MQRVRLGFQTRPFPAVRFHPQLQLGRSTSAFRFPARPSRQSFAVTARSNPNKEVVAKPSPAWRSFWATIDAGAWLGTVGSAVAFLLTQEAILVGGPILLPIIALYASKQRGKLDSQAAQAELQIQVATALRQVAVLSEESAAEVAEEVAALVDEVRQGRSSPEKAVRTVEAKLSSVEGTMRSIEQATQGALEDAAVDRSKAVKEISAALVSLRRDVNADLRQATGDELAALGKVDGRLAALEGAISGLEVAQSEGLRRLGSSMSGALLESKDILAAALRDEVWQSLEPVRQLPQALAAAAPGLAQSAQSIDEESIRALVAQEIATASQELLEKQRELLQEALATPTTIAPAQWNQLGKKLVALDDQLTGLKTEQQVQMNNLLQGEDSTAVTEQVALLRSELVELSQSVKSALEQQQIAQNAALALAAQHPGGTAAVAEDLFLGPLEASLLALQNELRAAAEVAAVDRRAPDSQWLVDLEIKLVKLVNPVLEAIALARQTAATSAASTTMSTTVSNNNTGDDVVVGSSSGDSSQLAEATAGIASMSEKLEALGSQLASLEERLITANSSGSGSSSGGVLAENRVNQDEVQSSNSSVIGVVKEDEESIAKKEAYQRMQALLRGGSSGGSGSGNNNGTNAVGGVADKEEKEEEEEEVNSGSSFGATGVPISDWLSLDDDEEEEKEDDATVNSTAAEKKEVTAAVVGGSSSINTTNGVSSVKNLSFIQEQIAFEAALAAGEDDDITEMKEDDKMYSTNSNNGNGAVISSSSSSSSPPETAAVAPNTEDTNEDEEKKEEEVKIEVAIQQKEEIEEEEQEAPIDLQALYTQGLELLRQGRAYAAAAAAAAGSSTSSSVSPGQRDALNAADAALTEAARCFQAASSIPDDIITVIKAIGNNGNALMARARVKRQLARIMEQQQRQEIKDEAALISGNEKIASLQSEAKELLVLAGRRYRDVLVNDPSQGRAFLNWGRAVCLRAEMAKESEDFSSAYSLFSNAAEKFQAALQLDAEPAEGLKMAGAALASAATCITSENRDGNGGGEVEDEEERRALLEEAEGYLVAAVDAGAGEEAVIQLEECRKLLDAY